MCVEPVNVLENISSERRAAIVFFALMWVAVAVAGVSELMVRRMQASSTRVVNREQPIIEEFLRFERDLHQAQLSLAAARYADSRDARRVRYRDYAVQTARALDRIEHVEEWVVAHPVVAELTATALAAQQAWSASSRALIAAFESNAGQDEIEARWRDVEVEFRFVSQLVAQVTSAGLAPVVAAGRAELTARANESKILIGAALLLGLVVSSLIILLSIRVIRKRKLVEDVEISYRDFDRRVQRALQLIETEREVLEVVHDALDQVLGRERRAELIMADSSRSKVKRLASSSKAEQWHGCQVATPQGCPTMRRNTRMVFESNRTFEACPHFRHDEDEPCSATCIPVSVMGHTVGVLHTIGPEYSLPAADELRRLDSIALKAGDKLGLVRTFSSKDMLANTDALTGLYNRRALEAQIPALMEANEMFSVAYGDLDHFKKLNDVHGHDAGDNAIRLFSEALRATLRPTDLFARWGGEEFLIVLPGSTMHDSVRVLDRLRERLKHRVDNGNGPKFTASFGVSDSSMANDFETIVHRADEALLRAKRNGRDRVERDGDWDDEAALVAELEVAAVGG